MMKTKRKYLAFLLAFLLTASTGLLLSCEEGDLTDCTGCPDDAPWSTLGASSCYETLAECEANLSGTCTICN